LNVLDGIWAVINRFAHRPEELASAACRWHQASLGQRGSKAIETGMANRLSPAQFNVLREEGTERPGSSPLNNEKRPGVFASSAVICCALKFIPKNGKESA
jgi:hypothetical protein